MRPLAPPSEATVRRVLVASVAITALHYSHNYIEIDRYPQPDWVHRETIYIAWFLLTLAGIAGYLLYRDGRNFAAGLYLLMYSYTGISSLGHYPYGSPGDFTTVMHLFIWTDALAGAAVAATAVRILITRGRRGKVAA